MLILTTALAFYSGTKNITLQAISILNVWLAVNFTKGEKDSWDSHRACMNSVNQLGIMAVLIRLCLLTHKLGIFPFIGIF